MKPIGWISIHRKLLDNPIASKPAWAWLWVFLLLKANHEDKEMIWNNEPMMIKRGQLLTGLQALSKESGVSIQSIRSALSYLKSTNQITIKTSTKWRILTINNYSSYQEVTIKSTDKQQTSNKQATTNNNDNNENNITNVIELAPRLEEKKLVKQEYGNPNINAVIAKLENHIGTKLDDTILKNRRYAHLLLQKYSDEQISAIFQALPQSKFWSTRVTKVSDIYYNAVKIINSLRETQGSYVDLSQ